MAISTSDRIKDIASRTGLDEAIVRRVLEAECASVAHTLSTGQTASLLGRCTIKSSVVRKPVMTEHGVASEDIVVLRTAPSKSLISAVQKLYSADKYDENADTTAYEIPRLATMQIEGLV